MASTGIGAPGTLSSALAPKKSNLVPTLLLLVGLVIAIGAAAYGYIESQRTEKVMIIAHPVPYGKQIVADDLATIELPLHRPVQMAGITDPSAVVGRWAARDLGQNDLVNASMLLAQPPDHPVYPNGRELHKNMVPVPFATSTIGPLTDRDLVNLGFVSTDPKLCNQVGGTILQTPAGTLIDMKTAPGKPIQSGTVDTSAVAAPVPAVDPSAPQTGQQLRPYACRFLQRLPVLYIDNATAYLETTPYQAHAIWALQASGSQLWGERYGVSSDPLPPIDKLDASMVTLDRLTAPITDTTVLSSTLSASGQIPGGPSQSAEPGSAGIPGSGGTVPGQQPTAAPAAPTAAPDSAPAPTAAPAKKP
jgi:hypothetical protein